MSSNEHVTYFGWASALEGVNAENENGTSQMLPSGSSGGTIDPIGTGTQDTNNTMPPNTINPKEDSFRASLVSRIDTLIWDFQEDRTTQMETLYQILQVLHEANVSESVRKATLEQYTLYVNIIASKQKGAEWRWSHAMGETNWEEPGVGICKGNLMIKHDAQILARGMQSILDKYNMVEGCIPCKGDPKRKL